MLLPFYAGHSVAALVLEQVSPVFNNASLPEDDGAEASFLQVSQSLSHVEESLAMRLMSSGLQTLCLVPLLIALNLGFAFVVQFIARRSRIHEANKREVKKDGEEDTALAAVIRDLKGVHCVYLIIKGWLTSDSYKWFARGICLLTVVHWFLREWTYAQFLSSLTADLTNAVIALPAKKDLSFVYSRLFSMLAWQLATAPLFLIMDPMIEMWFSSSLQSYITSSMIKSYLGGGGQAYYKLKMDDEKRDLDNPDQRISECSEQFCFMMYVLTSGFLSAVFGMLAWAGVMIQLGGPSLVFTCIGMAFLRLMISVSAFGNTLVDAYKDLLETGASLRYVLTRIRENAESIALAHGDGVEERRAKWHFDSHIDAIRYNSFVNMLFSTTLGIIDFFPVVILWVYQIPSIMVGALQMGDAMRCQTGYLQVAKVMDFMATSFSKLKQLQANGERLWALWEASDEANAVPRGASLIEYTAADPSTAFEVQELLVSAPGSRLAVGGASVYCEVGQGLLVTGGSGVGKSSILRALAGLWSTGEGTVAKSPGAEVVFLPQNAYFPVGSLMEAVIYPARLPSPSDAERSGLEVLTTLALKKALLGPLLRKWGLEEVRDWGAVLSAGERQRLGFARLFMLLSLRARREEKRKLSKMGGKTGLFSRAQSTSTLSKAGSSSTLSRGSGSLARRVVRSHADLKDYQQQGLKETSVRPGSRMNDLSRQTALSLVDLQQASALCGELPSTGVIAVLDESTSAVPVSVEASLYSELRKELGRGTLLALASVGHRPSLREFHDTELIIGSLPEEVAHKAVIEVGDWSTPNSGFVPWRHVSLGSTPSSSRAGESPALQLQDTAAERNLSP